MGTNDDRPGPALWKLALLVVPTPVGLALTYGVLVGEGGLGVLLFALVVVVSLVALGLVTVVSRR